MIEYISPHPALSFVELQGFGSTPIAVQVSIDARFLIISTYYKLTPVIATPENIGNYIGSLADLIQMDKDIFTALLLVVESESEELETRIRLDDPLLLVRSFLNLLDRKKNNPNEFTLNNETILESLKFATDQDDLINNLHYNMVNALKKSKG